jgi:hypothetical protein
MAGGEPLTWSGARRWAHPFAAVSGCRAWAAPEGAAAGRVVAAGRDGEPWFVVRSAAAGAAWLRALARGLAKRGAARQAAPRPSVVATRSAARKEP